ncbi:MAG: tetratricopeptide repeat protein [Halieaceae bacterium]|nr:tetratricopeptide repeat protein [Halieaceae bacterium]
MLQTLINRGGVLCLLLVMAGCSTYSQPESEPAPPPQPTAPAPQAPAPPQPPRPPQPPTTSAWKPLVEKAQQARARGDYEQALALLERAQRIDPESAEIYLQLAQTHKARGDISQARAVAERGMLFCTSSSQCDALRAFTR